MISVCIATYNGEKYIREQLVSILDQLGDDDEMVVSDDHSSDHTVEIVSEMKDQRIHLIKNTGQRGPAFNAENAMKHSHGDVIFLADQDDVWFPNKVSVMMTYLRDYDVVHCNSVVIDEQHCVLHDDFYKAAHNGRGFIKNIVRNTYYGSHMAFKRSLLDKAVPFPPTQEVGHDVWLGRVAEMSHMKIIFIQDKLMFYRRHLDTFTKAEKFSNRPLWIKLYGRAEMLYYCALYELKQLNHKRKL